MLPSKLHTVLMAVKPVKDREEVNKKKKKTGNKKYLLIYISQLRSIVLESAL